MKNWEQPDPSFLLFVAMKNWDSTFFKSRAEEVKFGQRQLIALEFIDVYIHFLNVGGLQSLIPGTIVTEITFFKITLKLM